MFNICKGVTILGCCGKCFMLPVTKYVSFVFPFSIATSKKMMSSGSG